MRGFSGGWNLPGPRGVTSGNHDQAHRAFGPGTKPPSLPEPGDRFEDDSGILFEQAMTQTRMAICLPELRVEDTPIVFANRAFRELTGYDEDGIVGRDCRFLQGPGTDPDAVASLSRAPEAEGVAVVELLDYRRDGTPL